MGSKLSARPLSLRASAKGYSALTAETPDERQLKLDMLAQANVMSVRAAAAEEQGEEDDGSGGVYGRYGCDTSNVLMLSTYSAMRAVLPNPKFVVVTGDWAGHGLESSERYGAIQVGRLVCAQREENSAEEEEEKQ
jgi:hypothetical protein